MKFIAHRCNTFKDFKETPHEYGVEVDIRSQGDKLIIHHDPFKGGENFDEWVEAYQHGTLILNVKEEGLEERLRSTMQARSIDDYFFLDQSFPFLHKYAAIGETRCAVRISEFESIETAMTLAGKINWVWADCFTHFPLSGADVERLQDAGFKICIVSPELQGREPEDEIPQLIELLQERNIQADAVCSKRADLWKSMVTSV